MRMRNEEKYGKYGGKYESYEQKRGKMVMGKV
jgi:hypothetical protein